MSFLRTLCVLLVIVVAIPRPALCEVDCGIWLAPSTIPGAGWGMYAGHPFTQGEALQPSGDLVIPIVDIELHNGGVHFPFLWDEYTWSAEGLAMEHEGHAEVNVASPGFGSAANSFLPIYNVEEGGVTFDSAGLDRTSSPGAGAFTYYHDRRSTAKVDIAAGQELFVTYGDNWFLTRPHFGPIPLTHDLTKATTLLHKFHKLQQFLHNTTLARQVWHDFVNATVFAESRVLGAFQDNDVENALFTDNTNATLSDLRIQQSQRDLAWLRQNGMCADHLVARTSTIAHAGRGAFATRDLPVGTVVAGLPLIHIPNRSRFDMYDLVDVVDDQNDGNVADNEESSLRADLSRPKRSSQLLLNYCWGHAESTLLLCPYGPMVNFVNHGVTPNVELRWATSSVNHQHALLSQPLDHMDASTAKLAFELVATRDIAANEEVLVDYGDAFAAAWRAHVANWPYFDDDEDNAYVQSFVANQARYDYLRTEFEMHEQGDDYLDNLELRCYDKFVGLDWQAIYLNKENNWDTWVDEMEKDHEYSPCQVLRYKYNDTLDETLYTATIAVKDDDDKENVTTIENVPVEAFHFIDRPYTTDMFLRHAFRHEARIPDHLFPDVWRNLRPSQLPNQQDGADYDDSVKHEL